MKGSPIDLYRCRGCLKLRTDRHITKEGPCKCGSWSVSGASPSNIFEWILCWWWALTLR